MPDEALNVRPEPRWRAIREQLRLELASYAYGSVFHSIADVARRFDVSSITAIRALTELANEGLIEKVHGKGHIVRQVKQSASIRLILPKAAGSEFLIGDPVSRRLYAASLELARTGGIDFNTISEAHLPTLFPRAGERFGFMIHRHVAFQTLDFLRGHDLPFVMLDPLDDFAGLPHARVDRVHAGYLATKHLIDLGHRRIGFVSGPICDRNFRERVKGYRKALAEADIPFQWALIRETDGFQANESDAALETFLRRRLRPTAIVAGDDNRALHLLDACRRRGLRVPEDMSVVGYPNYPEASLTEPPLTVVDACYEQVAKATFELLMAQIHGLTEQPQTAALIEPVLVMRATTGPIRAVPASTKRRTSRRQPTSIGAS